MRTKYEQYPQEVQDLLKEKFPKIKEILDAENFYSVFNKSPDAEITTALNGEYKKIALIVHPDKVDRLLEGVSEECKKSIKDCSTEAFKYLGNAFGTLRVPELKREYDIEYWTKKIEETWGWLVIQTQKDDLSPSEKDFIEQSCGKLINTIEKGIERIRNNGASNIMNALERDLQCIEAGSTNIARTDGFYRFINFFRALFCLEKITMKPEDTAKTTAGVKRFTDDIGLSTGTNFPDRSKPKR